MSEDNKFPGPPPPDDFSKTTPNVNIGGDDNAQYDWDKTNYNFPKQPAADDWGKTVTNIRPIDTENQDFGKTFYPGSQPGIPQTPDWGMTEANVRVNPADIGSTPEEFGGGGGYDKTTPYFRLPEAERAKYQNLPPTPTEKAAQEKREQEAKGGIPPWAWVVAGLLAMFTFAVLVLGVVYLLIIRDTDFKVSVRLAPPGSKVTVDDQYWGITHEDGSFELRDLKPGLRTIKIVHPNYECKVEKIDGKAGVPTEPITAKCTPIPPKPDEDCGNFKPGEFDKAERCYYKALAALSLPPNPEDLVRALNILIINFETNRYDIPQERLAALQKAAEYIKQLPPDVILEVGGHTDNVGNDASNLPLSERRANAVKDQLVKYGVRQEALQTRGYGSTQPKFGSKTQQTDDEKFLNRRIQYSIVRK